MEARGNRETTTGLEQFREKITEARRQAGRQQQELARALGLAPHVLSRKLHGLDQAHLTHTEVKQMIQTLATWDAIATQDEAIELLALMGLKPASFSEQEWKTAPLNRLEPSSRLASPPVQRTAPPSAERAATRSNFRLPAPLTSLVGRQSLVQLICERLRDPGVRLLTLLGPGGVGKTRVSLEVARQMHVDFADGVAFVSLASIQDPAWVPSTIAQVIGLIEASAERADHTYADLVKTFLCDKQVLLVLDNFEQVLDAGLFVRDLLEASPAVKVLVTSRAILHLSGEYVFGVPPLPFPDPHHLPKLFSLMELPAIRLFVERAQAVNASFRLTEQNAPVVAQICARLDGLPLTIELATARARLLSPEALLARLERRLETLTQGPRDAHSRQQTLRNTLTWSYDLLSPREQRLFRRLSVFVGSCSLKAIEAMYQTLGDETADLFEDAASLLDKSLLQQRDPGEKEQDDLRLSMLETIREYGLEVLTEQGALEDTRRAHASYYVQFAEEVEPHLRSRQQLRWLLRLEPDYENLRAALAYLLEQAETQTGQEQAEQALRLCSALFWYWYLRGYLREGRAFLERALAARKEDSPAVRAKALAAAAELAFYLEDMEQMEALCRESLVLFQELGDTQGMAKAHYLQGTAAWWRSRFAEAHAQLAESLSLFHRAGDNWGKANTLVRLGRVTLDQGECEEARTWFEQSLALFRALDDQQRIAYVLAFLARTLFVSQEDISGARALTEDSQGLLKKLGQVQGHAYVSCLLAEILARQGEVIWARLLAEESVAIQREQGDKASTAEALLSFAWVLTLAGDLAAARRLYEESLAFARAIEYTPAIASSLEGLGEVVLREREPAWAARLWGKAERLRQEIDATMFPLYRVSYERALATTRTQLGEQTFAEAMAQGRSMPLEQVLAAHEA
ncbi:MAG: ATP-binding protein [Ktedonobacteraceae bacterium]